MPDILLVDDDPDLICLAATALRSKGFIVDTAEHAVKALELLSKMDPLPSLIISDGMMPEMHGLDFFRRIRSDQRLSAIHLIFCAAGLDMRDVEAAFQAGASDYLIKPFHYEQLFAKVRKFLPQGSHGA